MSNTNWFLSNNDFINIYDTSYNNLNQTAGTTQYYFNGTDLGSVFTLYSSLGSNYTGTKGTNCLLYLNNVDIGSLFVQKGTITSISNLPDFEVSRIQGLSLWLDSNSSSSFNFDIFNNVSSWKDLSPNAYTFNQTFSSQRPTYSTNSLNGLPTVAFNKTNLSYLVGDNNATQFNIGTKSFSLFLVFNLNDNSSQSVFSKSCYGGVQGGFYCIKEDNQTVTINVQENNGIGTILPITDDVSNGSYRIIELICQRTVAGIDFVYENGILMSSGSTYTPGQNLINNNLMLLGAQNNTLGNDVLSTSIANFYLNGNIAEIISVSNNYDLLTDLRQNIEGYLAWKWGLNTSLPITHPSYKYFSPKYIINGGFDIPTVQSFTNVADIQVNISVPYWNIAFGTVPTADNRTNRFLINNSGSSTCNNIPVPAPFTQYFVIQSAVAGNKMSIYQSVYLPCGNYQLSFYLSAETFGNYSSDNTLSVYLSPNTDLIDGIPSGILIASRLVGSTNSWDLKQFNVNVASTGVYYLYFVSINPSYNNYTCLCFTGISFIPFTPPTNSVGLYACKLINKFYKGPIFNIRASTDATGTSSKDFYIDSSGDTITTGSNGSGTSLYTWLKAWNTYAYITKWYDQSGAGNHATQTIINNQPQFDTVSNSIYFNNSTYLNILNNNILGSGNVPYTVIFNSVNAMNLSSSNVPSLLMVGTANPNQGAYINISSSAISNNFTNNNLIYNSISTNNETVSNIYDTNNRAIYWNGKQVTLDTPQKLNLVPSSAFIGYGTGSGVGKFTGNLSSIYISMSALSDTDRTMIESSFVSVSNLDKSTVSQNCLLAYYPFKNDSNNYAINYVVNDLTLYNNANITYLSYNNVNITYGSLYLNASSSQYASIDSSSLNLTNNGLTFACWFNLTSSGYSRLFDFGNGPNSDNILYAPSVGAIGVYQGGNSKQVNIGNSLADGKWYHFVWTLSYASQGSSTSIWNVYINGQIFYTNNTGYYPNIITRTKNYIGKSNWVSDPYTTGYINDFRIYNRVLSLDEVKTLYNLPPGSVGLYACFRANNNYYGPIFKIRASTDSTGMSSTDFYIDKTGTSFNTKSDGNGKSLTTWLNGAIAYVNRWYDQSKQMNNADQDNINIQPIYDFETNSILFNGSTRYFYIKNNATIFPNTGNIPFTITFKSISPKNIASTARSIFMAGSTEGSVLGFGASITQTSISIEHWDYADTVNISATNNQVVTGKYDTNNQYIYNNGTLLKVNPFNKSNYQRNRAAIGVNLYPDGTNGGTLASGNFSYIYVSSVSLSDTDRLKMENLSSNITLIPQNNDIVIKNSNFAGQKSGNADYSNIYGWNSTINAKYGNGNDKNNNWNYLGLNGVPFGIKTYAFLQSSTSSTNSIYQLVPLQEKTYTLSFYYIGRTNFNSLNSNINTMYNNANFKVQIGNSIGGTEILNVTPSNGSINYNGNYYTYNSYTNYLWYYCSNTFTVSKLGAYYLTFSMPTSTVDSTILLTNVNIKHKINPVYILNNTFSSISGWTNINGSGTGGYGVGNAQNNNWNYLGVNGVINNITTYAYLQSSTTVTNSIYQVVSCEANTYTFSFYYIGGTNSNNLNSNINNYYNNAQLTVSLGSSINTTEVLNVNPQPGTIYFNSVNNNYFTTSNNTKNWYYYSTTFTITIPGSYYLNFSVPSASTTNTILFTNPTISPTNCLVNISTNASLYSLDIVNIVNCSGIVQKNGLPNEITKCYMFVNNMYQQIYLTPKTYTLSFYYVGRNDVNYTRTNVNNRYNNCLLNVKIGNTNGSAEILNDVPPPGTIYYNATDNTYYTISVGILSWYYYSTTFTVTTSNSYFLTFIILPPITGDILVTGITITPPS